LKIVHHFTPAHLCQGQVSISVGVKLLEQFPPLLLGVVGALEGQLLVDLLPVDVARHDFALACALCVAVLVGGGGGRVVLVVRVSVVD
jgi:hypothetical protein